MSKGRSHSGHKRRTLFFAFLIICVLAIVGISLRIIAPPDPAIIDKQETAGLLEILLRYPFDHFGKIIEKADFLGRPNLLLFMNAKRDIDLILFHKVYAEWNARGLNLVVIADDPGSIFTEPAIDFDGVWVLADRSRELGAFFDVSDKNPSFILFNGRGDRIATGDNDIGYERGVRIYLAKALGLRPPVREVFAPVGQYIQDINWLTDMKLSFVNSGGTGSVLVFLNSFCETCNSWNIMERLRKSALPGETGIRPVFILSSDFSPKDRLNLEERYEPGFPIIVASQTLADKLHVLHEDYLHEELNNIMLLVSNEGEIIACADAECACYRDVLIRAEEIMKTGRGK